MHMTRFEPWSIVDLLHRDLDRIAKRRYDGDAPDTAVAQWTPAIDIVEEKNRFALRADLPGVDPNDIEISMDAGTLTISGSRLTERQSQDGGISHFERSSGRFYRRFSLPDTADADNIKARSKDGILEVDIPKKPEVQARRISIEAA